MTQERRPPFSPSEIGAQVEEIMALPLDEKFQYLDSFPRPGSEPNVHPASVRPARINLTWPEWGNLSLLAALGIAGAAGVIALFGREDWLQQDIPASTLSAAQSFGTEDALKEARSKRAQSAEIQPEPQGRASSLVEQTIKNGLREMTSEEWVYKKWWVIKLPKPVEMNASIHTGIWVRKVPDIKIKDNRIFTLAAGDQPQIEAIYWGHNIKGEVSFLTWEGDSRTNRLVMFAVFGGENPKFIPVDDSQDQDGVYVEITRDGKILSLEEVLAEPGVVLEPISKRHRERP